MDKGNHQAGTQTEPQEEIDDDKSQRSDDSLARADVEANMTKKSGFGNSKAQDMKETLGSPFRNPNSNMPIQNVNSLWGKPDIHQAPFDEVKLAELHMRLNSLFAKAKKSMRGKEQPKDLGEMGKYVWATPVFITTYLSNLITKSAPQPVYDEENEHNATKPIEFHLPREEIHLKI